MSRGKNVRDSIEINPKTSRIRTVYDPILGFVSMTIFNPVGEAKNKPNKFKNV